MKKILSAVLVLAILALSVFAMASCGGNGLSGTYEMGETVEQEIYSGVTVKLTTKVTMTFSGNTITSATVLTHNLDELELGDVIEGIVEGILNPMVEAANMEMTATYKLIDNEDGTQDIELTYTDEDGETDVDEYSFVKGSDDKGEYVEIAGMKYYKV